MRNQYLHWSFAVCLLSLFCLPVEQASAEISEITAATGHGSSAQAVKVQMGHATPAPNNSGGGDADHDGVPDDWEKNNGTDPNKNDADEDYDHDGLTNLEEYKAGTYPWNPYSDGDAKMDGEDGWPLEPKLSPPRLPELRYTVIDLETTASNGRPVRVNKSGAVLTDKGAIWNAGTWTPAPSLEGYSYYWGAYALNDSGNFVAQGVYNANDTFLFAGFLNSTVLFPNLDPNNPNSYLESPWHNVSSDARDINSGGTIAGASARSISNGVTVNPAYRLSNQTTWHFLDMPSTVEGVGQMGDGSAFRMNESGHLIGYFEYYLPHDGSTADPLDQDFYRFYSFYSDGSNTGPVPAGFNALDLNDDDYVLLGPSSTADASPPADHYSLWKKKTTPEGVDALINLDNSFKKHVVLGKMNNRLEMLGGGTIVRNGIPIPLTDLISDQWTNVNLSYINQEGLIVGVATRVKDDQGVAIPANLQQSHGALLLPVEMTWKAQDGYENVEDNKKVTAVDSSDNPTTKVWMQGKGSRIFPDKKNPTDSTQNRNRCILHIKGGIPNYTIYLKSFDVDDATPDSVDNDPAHKLDPNGKAGDDNMDTVNLRSGKFVSSGSNTATVTLDNNGEADVAFETTKQPGDNFRVAAAFKQEDLNVPQVSNPDGNGFIEGDSAKQAKGFNGVVSPMLTVWRRIWLEFDSMGPPPNSKAAQQPDWELNHDEGVVFRIDTDTPSLGKSTLRLHVSNSPPSNVGQLTQPDNTWENGRIDIAGVGSFALVSAENRSDYAEVVIAGTPGSAVVDKDFKMYDDDAETLLGNRAAITMPYQLSTGKLIYTAYADAFIEPIKAPANYIQTNTPFKRNLSIDYYFSWLPAVSAHHDLNETSDLWTVYLLCGWQGTEDSDYDPDSGDRSVGQSDYGPSPVNIGVIYIETMRETELNPTTPKINEQHAIVHESGHQGGGEHTDQGIMEEGSPISENAFKPITIKRFRENQIF